ncbi:hypothetical protein PHLCEN_2v5056 [Hermanssonia centrifuga]|uniref:RecA family profile 1 domain-containing protein n=1 Tax=Hermanssonia centrifuga TaxID=98765 RepID=A0A2R6PCB4_9APHY|nr:hypothetical protein PHLCEN_2v5056 [Hermanssonia centrifuga]
MKTTTIPALVHVLSKTLPDFLQDLNSSPNAKPVRLLVIDALTELFHSDDKVSSPTMIERSRNLVEISNRLHSIANKHRIAVVVLNEVVDVFHRDSALGALDHEVGYREQARLFNRADSIPGEGQKEAALGLVWANQINARIMLSRTKRMRYLETESRATKRRRLSGRASADPISTSHLEDQPTRIRRLTVIFSSVAPPASLDYIVTECGVAVLDDQEQDLSVDYRPQSPMKDSTATMLPVLCPVEGVAPLDIPTHDSDLSTDSLRLDQLPNSKGLLQSDGEPATTVDDGRDAEDGPQGDLTDDEFEVYWRDMDFGSDFFSQLDEGVSLSGIDRGRAADPGDTSSTNAA